MKKMLAESRTLTASQETTAVQLTNEDKLSLSLVRSERIIDKGSYELVIDTGLGEDFGKENKVGAPMIMGLIICENQTNS